MKTSATVAQRVSRGKAAVSCAVQLAAFAQAEWAFSDNWRATGSLYDTNLTDEEYLVGGTALVESQGVGGTAWATPRMYGAELEYRF